MPNSDPEGFAIRTDDEASTFTKRADRLNYFRKPWFQGPVHPHWYHPKMRPSAKVTFTLRDGVIVLPKRLRGLYAVPNLGIRNWD